MARNVKPYVTTENIALPYIPDPNSFHIEYQYPIGLHVPYSDQSRMYQSNFGMQQSNPYPQLNQIRKPFKDMR